MAPGPVLLNLILIHAMEESRRNNRVKESDVGTAFGKNVSSSFDVHFPLIFFSCWFYSIVGVFELEEKKKKVFDLYLIWFELCQWWMHSNIPVRVSKSEVFLLEAWYAVF